MINTTILITPRNRFALTAFMFVLIVSGSSVSSQIYENPSEPFTPQKSIVDGNPLAGDSVPSAEVPGGIRGSNASAGSDQSSVGQKLSEGVFRGKAHIPTGKVNEHVEFYQGPLPKDRDPNVWHLEGDHRGNAWFKDWLTEEHVMRGLFRKFDVRGQRQWEIGVGTGGQLYSWQGPWGEALPPQFGPWVDEVWQANYHSDEAQKIIYEAYEYDPRESNIHNTIGRAFVQASASLHYDAEPGKGFFPSPMVAEWYDPDQMAYTTVNLALSPGLPTLIYHHILVYHRYRYMGNGVIEVTVVSFNFGDWTYAYGGIPWGGVRTTAFPDLHISNPDGTYDRVDVYYGEENCGRNVSTTDGWILATDEGEDPHRQAFAFIYGRDYPYEKIQTEDPRASLVTFGRAGRTPDGSPNSRAFTVMANSVRGKMTPGEEFWVRYYLSAGPLDQVLDNAKEYGGKGDYGVLEIRPETATTSPLFQKTLSNGDTLLSHTGESGSAPVCRVFNEPVRGSVPLFTIRELPEGKTLVTTDIYALSRKEKYNNPVPKESEHHAYLEEAYKSYVYESESLKPLKWDLLGYVLPSEMIATGTPGYRVLSEIVQETGLDNVVALAPAELAYHQLHINPARTADGGLGVEVEVTLENLTRYPVKAAPRVFVKDAESSVPVADRVLGGGVNELLQPGEERTIRIPVDGEAFSLITQEGAQVIEPGLFQIEVGPSPYDIRLEGEYTLEEAITLKTSPSFEYADLSVPEATRVNESFQVGVTVRNAGERRGTHIVSLMVDGEPLSAQSVHLSPGNDERVTFTTSLFKPGSYTLRIGGEDRTVQVTSRPAVLLPSALKVEADTVFKGDPIRLSGVVTNLGSESGDVTLTLLQDGNPLKQQTVSVPAAPGGMTEPFQFEIQASQSGFRQFSVNGGASAEVLVLDKIEHPFTVFSTTWARMGRHGNDFIIDVQGGDVFQSAGSNSDDFGAIASLPISGDFSVSVRVDDQDATFPYAKAGLMIRNGMQKGSSGYAAMCITPEHGVVFLYDSDENGFLDRPTESAKREKTGYPVWLKLERNGHIVSGFHSPDGSSWTRLASVELPGASAQQQVAIFASAYNLTKSGRARFSQLSLNQNASMFRDRISGFLIGSLEAKSGAPRVRVEPTGSKPPGIGENLAMDPRVKITGSSSFGNRLQYTPQKAVDGAKDTEWVSRAEGADAWMELDLGRPVRITHIGYQSRGNQADWVHSFTVTDEQGRVQECHMVEKDMKRMQYFDMNDVTTRFLRWDALNSVEGNTGVRELAIFGEPLE